MDSLRIPGSISNPLLDFDELSARCLGRLELVVRVLNRFQDSMGYELAELEEALRNEDVSALSGISHRIWGTSLTVSAHALQERVQLLEAAVKSGSLDAIGECVEDIKSEWDRLSTQINQVTSRS